MKKQGISRRLGFESLEQRALMASNVTASVVDNVLVITGDDASNFIEIRQLPAAESTNPWPGARYEIINPYGTPTLINGQSSVIVEGVKNGVQIDMKGGDDLMYIYRPNAHEKLANLPGLVSIDMGAGADRMSVRVINHQQTTVSLGTGSDAIGIIGTVKALTVNGDPQFDPADPTGNDEIDARLTASGPVVINTQFGADRVSGGITTTNVDATININTGSGNDQVNLQRDAILRGAMRIETGDGHDFVTLGHQESNRNIVVNTGRGNDYFIFADLSVAGTLSAWLGEGDDLLGDGSSSTNRAGKVVFRGWDGTDTLDLKGTNTFDEEDITGFEIIK